MLGGGVNVGALVDEQLDERRMALVQVQGLGFGVQGLSFKVGVQGLGLRVSEVGGGRGWG